MFALICIAVTGIFLGSLLFLSLSQFELSLYEPVVLESDLDHVTPSAQVFEEERALTNEELDLLSHNAAALTEPDLVVDSQLDFQDGDFFEDSFRQSDTCFEDDIFCDSFT